MVLQLTRVAHNTALTGLTTYKGLGLSISVDEPDGVISVQNDAGQDIKFLPWDHGTDTFGVIVTTDSAPIAVNNACFTSPAGDVLFVWDLIGGTLHAWALAGGAVGAHLSSIATALGNGCGLDMTPDGTRIIFAGSTAPYVKYCTWDGANFSALTTPGTPPSVGVPTTNSPLTGAVAVAPDGSAVAIANSKGDLTVYPIAAGTLGTPVEPNGAKTFGASANGATAVTWNPAGDVIFLAGDDSPFLCAYAWDGATLTTALAVPSIVATGGGSGQGVICDKNGEVVFLCGTTMDNSRGLYAYPWDGSSFGARIDPDIAPAVGVVGGMCLSPDNTRLFTRDSAVDIDAWETGLTLGGATGTGTLIPTVPEGTLRGHGGTVTVDLTGDTFVAEITPEIVQDIIDGMVGSGAGPHEWNNTGKPGATVDRVSDTEIIITIPPLPGYDTEAGETVTITIPGSALSGGSDQALDPSPAFTITAGPLPAGGGPQPWQSSEREALRVLATAQGTEVRRGVQAVERTLQELLAEITGGAAVGPFPTDREKLLDAIFDALGAARVRNVKETYILDAIERYLP